MNTYTTDVEKPEEMDQFLQTHNMLRLNYKDTKILRRTIRRVDMVSLIQILPTRK